LWPAFWLLVSNFSTTGWPDCGEIDIMDHLRKDPALILGSIHGPGYSGAIGLTKWKLQPYDITDEFHTYAIEWDKDRISWFYDDVQYSIYSRSDVEPKRWAFEQTFFIILKLAIGGILGPR
jgi:beta-glucanase (GH16 family)